MFEKIMIIGIGSLGGYIATSISNLEKIKELTIIDPDIVEEKNLKNSIYRRQDIGKLKIDALEEIIKYNIDEIKIIKSNTKILKETDSIILKYDLIIDCRDYIYNRANKINIRPFISTRYLILDCRQNIKYRKKCKGKYISKIIKADFGIAAPILTSLIESNAISKCIKDKGIYKFDLDYAEKSIKLKKDIIYDLVVGSERLSNLDNTIFDILNINKKNDITICAGPKNNPIAEKLVLKKTLINSCDVVTNLVSMLSSLSNFKPYIVYIVKSNHKYFVELIQETGAA